MKYDGTQTDERDENLLKQLAALPRSRRPDHDAWQEISIRIGHEKSMRIAGEKSMRIAGEEVDGSASTNPAMRGWLALAASVLLVAVSSVFMMNSSELSAPAVQPMAEVRTDQLFLNEIGARVPANSLEREYQAAFREFVRLDVAHAGPTAIERAAIQQDWQLMLQLEQKLKAALQLEPENPWLAQRLRKLRAQQLQLLRVSTDTGLLPGRNLT